MLGLAIRGAARISKKLVLLTVAIGIVCLTRWLGADCRGSSDRGSRLSHQERDHPHRP